MSFVLKKIQYATSDSWMTWLTNSLSEDGHILLTGEHFAHLREDQTYKYLGINETDKIDRRKSIVR